MNATLVISILLVPGWVYLIAAAAAAICFSRRRLPSTVEKPAVSILKPLHGDEPGLYQNLRSFIEQDYPELQMVLGVDDRNDGALPAAEAVMRDLPQSDIAVVVEPCITGSNAKISNLENMMPTVHHDILVLADSDMRVDRRYLGAVTAPLHDRRIGIVTCLYKGRSTGGIWSGLGACYINFGFLPGALLADAMRVGNGCFGATIALRRESLHRIGGFAAFRDELADDHRMGDLIRARGLTVALSPYLVEARVTEPSFAGLWRHELRWARTVRTVAPVAFGASLVAHPVAIAALGAAATGFASTSCIFLAISWLLRWGSARTIAAALGLPGGWLWLLPARDALSFAVFVASFFGRTVIWRGQHFRVEPSGRMTVDGDEAL